MDGEQTMEMINFKKKKMKLLTKKQQEFYKNTIICYICKENFENEYIKDKIYRKVTDDCHYTAEYTGAAPSISNFKI